MHDGMQYEPIQGQGHEAIYESYLLRYLQRELATDNEFLN